MFLRRLLLGVGLLASASVALQAQNPDPPGINGFVWTANVDVLARANNAAFSPVRTGVVDGDTYTKEPIASNSAIVPLACTVTALNVAAYSSKGNGAGITLVKNGGYNGFLGTPVKFCGVESQQGLATCSDHQVREPDNTSLRAGDILTITFTGNYFNDTHVTTTVVCN
jgi:hypothetical protein